MRFLLLIISLILPLTALAFDEFEVAPKLGLDVGMGGKPWTFLGTTSVFVNEDLSRQMMVVRNATGKLKSVQFIDAPGYLIVNIPEGKETFTSLALVGIPRESILPYLDSVTFSWKNLLTIFPSAQASVCGTSGMPAIPGLTELTTYFTTGPGAGFARCLMNFAQGAWSATGGVVTNFIQGVGNLLSDPRGFWDGKVAQMRNMWNFVTHFRQSMNGLIQQVQGLTPEIITQMMCGFLGGVGAGIAVALLTGGAGLGPLMARVTSYVTKITGLARVFSLLGSLGRLATIPGRFFEGIASGRIGEAVIDRLDAFARNRMNHLVEGAIQCAL